MNFFLNRHKSFLKAAMAVVFIVGITACTGNFMELNTNPIGVTDEQANGDYALIASFLAQAQRDIIPQDVGEYQLANNLCSDVYGGYFGAEAPCVGDANNLTYS